MNKPTAVARLQIKASKLEQVKGPVVGFIVAEDDQTFVKRVAKLMQDTNWATSQREDAGEILRGVKMDGDQVMMRFDNLIDFLGTASKVMRRIRGEVKQEMQDIGKD